MHVTIALPWWWHTIRSGNNELTKTMAQRFKQTLLLKFHYPFQIELERIILLGGKVSEMANNLMKFAISFDEVCAHDITTTVCIFN